MGIQPGARLSRGALAFCPQLCMGIPVRRCTVISLFLSGPTKLHGAAAHLELLFRIARVVRAALRDGLGALGHVVRQRLQLLRHVQRVRPGR